MKRVDQLSNFKRMIAKLAWNAWCLLPRQHQIWIGLDDLIEDATFKTYQVIDSQWYNPNKSNLSTTIYHVVHNHLINEYVKRYSSESRFATLESAGIIDYNMKRRKTQRGLTPAGLVSLDNMVEGRLVIEPPQLSTSEESIYANTLTECFVVPTLVNIYQEASNRLQGEMLVWFLQNREKIHTHGRKFNRAAREFRMLSDEYKLTYQDCSHLFHSPQCMDKLSRELLHVPYLLEYPTPKVEKLQ